MTDSNGDEALSGFVLVRIQALEVLHVRELGPLPQPIGIDTVFWGAPCIAGREPQAVRALLDFLASPECDEAKRRHGMAPA